MLSTKQEHHFSIWNNPLVSGLNFDLTVVISLASFTNPQILWVWRAQSEIFNHTLDREKFHLNIQNWTLTKSFGCSKIIRSKTKGWCRCPLNSIAPGHDQANCQFIFVEQYKDNRRLIPLASENIFLNERDSKTQSYWILTNFESLGENRKGKKVQFLRNINVGLDWNVSEQSLLHTPYSSMPLRISAGMLLTF